MTVNRFLSIYILLLIALGFGAAGMLSALRTTVMRDVLVLQTRLATTRSLAPARAPDIRVGQPAT